MTEDEERRRDDQWITVQAWTLGLIVLGSLAFTVADWLMP